MARAQGCRGADPAMAVEGRIDRLRRRGRPRRADAEAAVERVADAVERLSPLLPHDSAYHEALVKDLRRWAEGGFQVPDFLDSCWPSSPPRTARTACSTWSSSRCTRRTATRTATWRRSCCAWSGRRWLAELERTRYDNPLFCGITFEDFTRATTPTRPCSSGDDRRPRGAGTFLLGWHLLRPRGRALPPRDRGRRGHPGSGAARGHRRHGHDQKRCEECSSCGTWSTTAPTATATCRSTRSWIKQRQPFWMYGLEELRLRPHRLQGGREAPGGRQRPAGL